MEIAAFIAGCFRQQHANTFRLLTALVPSLLGGEIKTPKVLLIVSRQDDVMRVIGIHWVAARMKKLFSTDDDNDGNVNQIRIYEWSNRYSDGGLCCSLYVLSEHVLSRSERRVKMNSKNRLGNWRLVRWISGENQFPWTRVPFDNHSDDWADNLERLKGDQFQSQSNFLSRRNETTKRDEPKKRRIF